jgi:hypothetical protein
MAEGWVLVVGVAALLGLIGLTAVTLNARRGSLEAQHGLLALGPALVALGIIFGENPVIGYGLIAAGVIIAVAVGLAFRGASGRFG